MAALNIAIGSDIFKEIRENNCCYVDKTSILEEMLTRSLSKVSLITRPRRFGKTLTMTMLREFFDIRRDSRALFEGLAVSQNAELCQKWMNRYPTVFLTLKGIEGTNYCSAVRQFKLLISNLMKDMRYLTDSPRVGSTDKLKLSQLESGDADDELIMSSLLILSQALEAHWGMPAILLIDEYDVPINYAEQNGYYKEMVCFMRNMLGAALKTNASLKFAVLTGCLRIAKESIFTGLNNFMCYSVSDADYADKFGFTESEVDALLAAAELSDKKPDFKEWYDGYRFGEGTEIYCPWDILAHLVRLQKNPKAAPQAYWNNTSGNAIVRTLINRAGEDTRDKIERLIDGSAVEEDLAEDLTYDIVYESESNIWT
ncbi:AAA family ATPase, partial [bacterium]|nr:AAA family ATPase [bacterium]